MSFFSSSDHNPAMPSATCETLTNRSAVSGRRSHNAQLRRSFSSSGSSCRNVTSAPSGHTATHRLQPLHASGFTVIERSPPPPFCFASTASKNGFVLTSGNSDRRCSTTANSLSVWARRSGSHAILSATAAYAPANAAGTASDASFASRRCASFAHDFVIGRSRSSVEQRRDMRHHARLLALVDRARRNGLHLIVPAADHAQVVFHDVPATMAELLLELLAYALEYLRLGRPLARDQRRRAEERTEERRTLHPVPHLDVGGFFSRDRERVEDVELDVPFEDRRARAGWQRAPERVGGEVALDHEHAAVGESVERVAVTEHIRVGRQDDVDVFELAVQQ